MICFEILARTGSLNSSLNRFSSCKSLRRFSIIDDYAVYTHASCSKSDNKPSTSCVRNACPKLSTSMDIIRLVARLFQQVRYSHDKTILLQPCVVNPVTFLHIMTVSDFLEQLCNKSDNAIKFLPNLLQQLGTQIVDNIVNTQYKTLNNNVTVTKSNKCIYIPDWRISLTHNSVYDILNIVQNLQGTEDI